MAGRRRGRGEGSIYRRKDGRWVGQYEVNGKRRYVYGQTRKEVAEKLNKALAERDAGLDFDAKNLSLAKYLDRWLDTIRGTLAPNSVRRYEELTRIHIKPALGKVKLSKLDPLRVQSFYRSKLDEGLSAATVVKIHSTLSKSLKQAVRWRLIPLNVCESVTPPRIARTEIAPMDAEQLKALLKAANKTDLYALWVLLATTGLRIGEALALRWDDLDVEARTLRVNRTVFRNVFSQPKTKSSRRTIKLSGLAIGVLRQHPRTAELVFCTASGKPINPSNLRNRSWKRLLECVGLPPSTHEFANYLTNRATGSAYPAVNIADFEDAKVLVPPDTILPSFHKIVVDLLGQQENLRRRIDNLRRTRDLLLPKLISGEVDVEQAGIESDPSEVRVGS